jgi:hypothetical protein
MRTRAVRTYNFFANFSVAKCGHIISETLSSDLFARVAQPPVRRSGLPSAVGWPAATVAEGQAVWGAATSSGSGGGAWRSDRRHNVTAGCRCITGRCRIMGGGNQQWVVVRQV